MYPPHCCGESHQSRVQGCCKSQKALKSRRWRPGGETVLTLQLLLLEVTFVHGCGQVVGRVPDIQKLKLWVPRTVCDSLVTSASDQYGGDPLVQVWLGDARTSVGLEGGDIEKSAASTEGDLMHLVCAGDPPCGCSKKGARTCHSPDDALPGCRWGAGIWVHWPWKLPSSMHRGPQHEPPACIS